MKPNNVLILANHEAIFSGLLPLSIKLKEKKYTPIFIINFEFKNPLRSYCEKKNIRYIEIVRAKKSEKKKIKNDFISFINSIYQINKEKNLAKKLIKKYSPKSIISGSDRQYGLELSLLAEAKKNKISTLLVITAFPGIEGAIKIRENNEDLIFLRKTIFTKLIEIILLKQICEKKGKKFLFYPPHYTLACFLMGVLPNNPWYIGGGNSDKISVFNNEIKNDLIKGNVNREKIHVTGSPEFDELYYCKSNNKLIRKKIEKKYELAKKKPIIICALPHLGEHFIISKNKQLLESETFFDVFKKNPNVLVSLHPKMNRQKYLKLSNSEVKILSENLREVLPIADLFIAGNSSTILWALELKIPAILIDSNKLNYRVWEIFKDITITNSITQLNEIIKRKLTNRKAKNKDFNSNSELIDGRASERIINLLEDSNE